MSIRSEIFDQPKVLARLLASRMDEVQRIGRVIASGDIEYILLAARGTSDNAGLYAKYLWGIRNRTPVALAAPSMYGVYQSPPRLRRTLVVGISQSGESPDIVNVVREGRAQGVPTLAITNAPDSSLARTAEHVLCTDTGAELSVAATKTYTAELMAIAMISAAWSGGAEERQALERVPDLVNRALELEPAVEQAAARYREMTRCVVLGRGYNFASAHEWALKLQELTYVVAVPFSSADFLHGPVAMLDRDFPVLTVAPEGAALGDLLPVLREVAHSPAGDLLAISNQPEVLQLATTPLAIPADVPEWLSPIVGIAPAQLFCLHLGTLKGLDVEHPRGLQKVTKTW